MHRELQRERTALRKSIQHWERLLEYALNDYIVSIAAEGWHADSCECCITYHNIETCGKCPIKKITGFEGCDGTPWYAASTELDEYIIWNPSKPIHQAYKINKKAMMETTAEQRFNYLVPPIKKELEFLYDVFKELHPNFSLSTVKTPIIGDVDKI